jgi:hypothetical protein
MSGGGGKVSKGKMGSSVIMDVDQKTVDDWGKPVGEGWNLCFIVIVVHFCMLQGDIVISRISGLCCW